ncbi:MaoC/PaaZ C-terminal domain-containing protein [Arsukibacterium sp.]|uniref:MaoC/PaaZ C-terminal domain-containing protein n=1 Tax=Arsukibacterium sp. TaxID=1977258 RepID=UPI002FDB35A6
MSALPALWPLYAKALWPKALPPEAGCQQTELTASASAVLSPARQLARYQQLCQLAQSPQLPPCWPNVLAFGLQLRLLLQSPFPVMGLVHLSNHISQFRPILVAEPLDIKVRLAPVLPHEKGVLLPLVTEVYRKGQLVWQQQACHLYRTRTPPALPEPAADAPALAASVAKNISVNAANLHSELKAPRGTGWRYGWLSGDINPIHLSDISARLFGFKAALAHGMWSKARILAALAPQAPAFDVSVNFSSPLLLPDRAHLHCQQSSEHGRITQHFALASPARQRLLLSGQLQCAR